jgi:hypothetical protein
MLVLTIATVAAAGCSTPRGVPGGADLVTEATVKSSFQSPADGMLYIYRSAARGVRGQLHYSGPVLAGQTLVIDPANNRVTLDGEPLEVLLPGGDVLYQAYFRRDPSVRRAVSNARNASSGGLHESTGASTREAAGSATRPGSMIQEERHPGAPGPDAPHPAAGAGGTE